MNSTALHATAGALVVVGCAVAQHYHLNPSAEVAGALGVLVTETLALSAKVVAKYAPWLIAS